MSQIPILIQQQNNRISALQASIEGSISRGLLYAVAGDYILYGCKVTQGSSAADMYLALDGEVTGDETHLNPDIETPALRIEQYPNIAMVYGRAFAVEDINKSTTNNTALLVADAPGTVGYGRYDIVYIYVNNTGPAIGIATGTAANTITSLSTGTYPVTGDPTLVQGCFPIARVYVTYGNTGIANAAIHDLRDFVGRLKGEAGVDGIDGTDGEDGHSPVLTWDGDQIAIDGTATGPHLTGPTGATGMGFIIAKTYASVAALEADTTPTGIVNGQFAIIETGDVDDGENARLYLWNDGYTYVTDLSGSVGITGNGIDSIVLFSGDHSPGTTDTYRITFTDTTTFDFTVYNGADGVDGTGSGDMLKSVYDPDNDGKIAFAQLIGVAAALGNDDNYVTDAEKILITNSVQSEIASGTVAHQIINSSGSIFSTSTTGAIRIKLIGLLNSGVAMSGKMRVELQSTAFTATLYIGGYFSSGNVWTQSNVTMLSSTTTPVSVRYCTDSGGAYIVIGDTNSTWGAIKVAVVEALYNDAALFEGVEIAVVQTYPTNVDIVATVNVMLKAADIGSTVQAYDADLTSWAGKTAPAGDVVGTSDNQALTNKTYTGLKYTRDDDGTVSGGTWAIDYANGPVIKATAGADITSITMSNWPASGTEGHVRLKLVNFGAYNITFPAAWNWVKSDLTTTTTFGDLGLTLPASGMAEVDLTGEDGGTSFRVSVRR